VNERQSRGLKAAGRRELSPEQCRRTGAVGAYAVTLFEVGRRRPNERRLDVRVSACKADQGCNLRSRVSESGGRHTSPREVHAASQDIHASHMSAKYLTADR
jgi:hypothetical protein